MGDINVYSEQDNYLNFQNLRPDYVNAIDKSIEFATNYISSSLKITLADFCCGTGNNTKLVAEKLRGIKKAILIDINEGFLKIAKDSKIETNQIEIVNTDILKARFDANCDLVLSIFAYHHVPDKDKSKYLSQVKKALKKGGILILTEIYFDNPQECLKYYRKLYESINKEKLIPGLKDFLEQTANSQDFEFKVSKKFADEQFLKEGFKKLAEKQIYPTDNSFGKGQGTFVQVYKF
ncbi:hypothetical protein COU54_02635 [Candidatus Pacearchaeota archaeon CG10_big_fil_rev_8_21_14_0_10_31_24]|nr:MAG: hypothetical protein COU54_02635 [Candidatus Pacearchaeota archaeon CG10_big_fil_rev_8_21_14_0_10_31_24]